MKRTSLLLWALLLLLFVGCDTVSDVGESNGGSTTENNASEIVIEKQPLNYLGDFAETPEGYYCGISQLLYFCPRGGSSFVPLCGKPDCKHNDRNCNAYIPTSKFIEVYDGALYTSYDPIDPDDPTKELFWGVGFAKRNLDGTEHAPVVFDSSAYERDGRQRYTYALYHGKAYVLFSTREETPLEQQEDHLIVMDLADGSSMELAEEYLREHRMKHFKVRDGKLYGFTSKDKGPERIEKEWLQAELDLTSGAVTEFPIRGYCASYVTDTTVYYCDVDQADFNYKAVRPGFNEYDRATGTVREFGMPVEAQNLSYVLYDSDYIYLSTEGEAGEKGTLYILSRDYQVVDQLSLRNNERILSVTSDRIYLEDPGAEKDPVSGWDCSMLCLQKSQIGSHNLNPEKVEIMIPNVEWVELQPGEEQS